MKIALRHSGERPVQNRNYAGNDDAVHTRQIEGRKREQVAHQHAPFIGGLFMYRAQAPAPDQAAVLEGADGDIAVSGIQS